MRNAKLKLSAILMLFIGLTGLHAQNAIPASGGNASGGGGTASYSVGQIVYTTNTGTNGSVTQGAQQPYEISAVTGIEEAKGISLLVSAYPNPTTDFLKLKIEGDLQTQYFASLYDISGKLLENKKITSNSTNIFMGNYISGTYFLKVSDNQKEIKTFKIIKN
jgi:hypothetical protein